jgi:hypothetical protein
VSKWNFMSYDSKDTLLPAVRKEAETFFALASDASAWQAPTAHDWEVRDVVGHLVDVTESYFLGFDVARGTGTAADALGLVDMSRLLNEGRRPSAAPRRPSSLIGFAPTSTRSWRSSPASARKSGAG